MATEAIHERLLDAFPTQPGARAAVDIAVHDWIGRRLGVPVASLLGLPTGLRMPTSFTISLGDRGSVAEAVEAADGWPLLKVKLGGEDDLGLMETIRDLTDALIRVDANAAWSVPEAIEKCRALAEMNVELVEQPIEPGRPDDLRRVREAVAVPIVADEDSRDSRDLAALVGCVDGVNIKLAKTGGLREGFRMALAARAMGLDVMLGTMAEGVLGTSAAAQLIPLARWADLDGPLLLRAEDDPFVGVRYEEGMILMPEGPGLGVRRAEDPERPS
jgi:L-alanine-DL-glutamate epimerase-like enolase superfamily enzyme